MDYAPLLLADPSPNLRRLALLTLFHRPADDPEVLELEEWRASEPLAQELIDLQQADGSWSGNFQPNLWNASRVITTAFALMRLGYLGFGPEFAPVRQAADFLYSRQEKDGSWPLGGEESGEEGEIGSSRQHYSMRPLQTALPLRGLAACGYATDPRSEKAYDWLIGQRLEDGAWPTGITLSGNWGYVAGYRRMAHSRWGCRSSTTGALICLALHPQRCQGPEARTALDLLLGRETREEFALGYEVARLVGAEEAHGFTTFYARFDLALLIWLCSRIGASLEDERVKNLVDFVTGLRGPYGMWEYHRKPQASRWLTLDLLYSLSQMSQAAEGWQSQEPRTPFQPYQKKQKRY